ncbi:MAG: response regulator [Lachnospiraceae bacterium]|nr:response regulator [Lachnospiraceae bacterium]
MKRNKKNIAAALIFILIMMIFMVIYTSKMVYDVSVSNLYEVGDDKIATVSATLENYLEKTQSTLWVTADTVDNMIRNGDSHSRILNYITEQSANQELEFDENYTGIYGLIDGEYLDGVGWIPEEGYDPKSRDWYTYGLKAKGKVTIVPPYVDAQTHAVIISICRMLSDGESVLSLDVTMNHFQSVVERLDLNDKGYGFILSGDGMIISHPDSSRNGEYFNETEEQREFMSALLNSTQDHFEAMVDGQESVVFHQSILGQWHAVIAVTKKEMYKEIRRQIVLNSLVNIAIFILIATFFIFSYRKERQYSKRIEELKIDEQKREYEARMLGVEKNAADRANKAKSEFLADMSHEIRTPINAVLGMNEMILHDATDETILDYSRNIRSAGENLLSIVNTILDFSKIEDGKMELQDVGYELAVIINNLVNSISERAKSKSLEFNVDIDPTIPSVLRGDDVRVTQIIMNLLTNAVKYTEKGHIDMRIKNALISDGAVLLDVSVADTGIGIKKEDLSKLTRTFERIEEERNRHIEGTGLGMSIVTKLLGMMGSELVVESVYGEGSVFSFKLKQKIEDEAPIGDYRERITQRNDEDRKYTLRCSGARVLVVDDNDMNIKVCRNLLKIYGIVPDTAVSGVEAIDIMRENNGYDIVFLDHMMPGMDGIETLGRLRNEKLVRQETSIIVLTANAVVGSREKYLKDGFDDYLSKPMEMDKLEDILRKYIPKELLSENGEDAGGLSNGAAEIAEDNPEKDEPLEFMPGDDDEADDQSAGIEVKKAGIADIEKLGLNTEAGLGYCGRDEDFYIEMLGDFADGFSEKSGKLGAAFESKDVEEYRILIHALKSNARSIGADTLSGLCAELEESAKKASADDGIPGFITENHAKAMEMYEDVAVKISGILK